MLAALDPKLLVYAVPMAAIWLGYFAVRGKRQRRALARREAAVQAGLTEPASLHPLIDVRRCVGCGSCVQACPEGNVLGLIGGKAELIEPTACIGHGACQAACPMGAITLVFGSARRGVDIPRVKPDFESNVPGLYIAGELGGMGLIRNAVEQGRQAMESIAKRVRRGAAAQAPLDVLIVGAGPAGLAASLAALQHELRFLTIEQDTLGGTVAHYPRGKLVMTAPVKLPLLGQMRFREARKEALLAFWQDAREQTGLSINENERLEALLRDGDGFVATTSRGRYRTRTVLLAIGRRGTPRTLDVPGEELPKVVYRLIDPEQYRGQHVLVVGGGDSALEAACSIAEQPGTTVTLSYRSESFSRAKEKNRRRVEAARDAKRLQLLMGSEVRRITPERVQIEQAGSTLELANDAVIVCAGGILPTGFLKGLGVEVDTKYGTA